ncbi:MAG TPA: hypothetical protein VIK89_14150 [Cytophagaceae bacterium]
MKSKRKLSREEYLSLFKGRERKALALAWRNRDFEIDLYWKRATYFWTFIAASFAGYVALISSESFELVREKFPQVEYVIICLGIVFSFAWLLVNLGSKKWQENWEAHIEILEDSISGPLYKTVLFKDSYSVSKLNKIVNLFVLFIWLILAVKYAKENEMVDLIIIASSIGTVITVFTMFWPFGKTQSSKKVTFSVKNVYYDHELNKQEVEEDELV